MCNVLKGCVKLLDMVLFFLKVSTLLRGLGVKVSK